MDTGDHKYVIVSCFLLVEHVHCHGTWRVRLQLAGSYPILTRHTVTQSSILYHVWLKPTILYSQDKGNICIHSSRATSYRVTPIRRLCNYNSPPIGNYNNYGGIICT